MNIRRADGKLSGMNETMSPHRTYAQDEIASALDKLGVTDQAAVLAEAMSRLLARSDADDIGVALFLETVCEVVPTRVQALRREHPDGGHETDGRG